ncbi:MAG: hypothetical protein KF832_02635 [Caldilineaceae bacterium]|nr:hypothetical protein [Caldilineaceae bacterium]
MLTWLLLGYLALSVLTSLFVYGAYVAAGRADSIQLPALESQMPTVIERQRMAPQVTTEKLSLSAL